LTLILIIVWPALGAAAGVFSKGYFAFWVLIAIAWGFGAAIVISILPVYESKEEVLNVLNGCWCAITGKEHIPPGDEVALSHFPDKMEKEEDSEETAPEQSDVSKAVAAGDDESVQEEHAA
jgi:hypothetical protein